MAKAYNLTYGFRFVRVIIVSEIFLSQAKKCFSHMFILIELSKGRKLTGYRVITNLRRFGFEVSPGTIYHQLGVLTEEGIIEEEKEPWGKSTKIIYAMTEKGKELFKQFKNKWEKPLEYASSNLKS